MVDQPIDRAWLARLHPGNFAMVMASGIIAVGLADLGFNALAEGFAVFAVLAWCVLLVLSGLRLIRHAGQVKQDLLNPRMVFAFFTLVAATDIIGMLAVQRGMPDWALVCWAIAFIAWCF